MEVFIYFVALTVCRGFMFSPGHAVLKLEFILKVSKGACKDQESIQSSTTLKINAMIGCLRTRVRKPIIVLDFDFETVLKFYISGAWFCLYISMCPTFLRNILLSDLRECMNSWRYLPWYYPLSTICNCWIFCALFCVSYIPKRTRGFLKDTLSTIWNDYLTIQSTRL